MELRLLDFNPEKDYIYSASWHHQDAQNLNKY